MREYIRAGDASSTIHSQNQLLLFLPRIIPQDAFPVRISVVPGLAGPVQPW